MGQRKLIRPQISPEAARRGPFRSDRQPLSQAGSPTYSDDNQAEVFYLQKQIQMQTHMVIVLEDGESIEGIIDWYDRESIHLRSPRRTIIYKHAIRYMFKHGEQD
jgi:RNA chaperone Hfq